MKLERILVPLDHSPGWTAVIDYARGLAVGAGASLTLLHVYEPPNSMVAMVPGATVDGELVAERAAGLELIAHAVTTLAASNFHRVHTLLERAPEAAAAIVERARDFDLIVMGTHARTGVPRLVMGSVAENVIRTAPCPVLALHLPEIARED